ncbi:MAG: cytochrome c [Arenicellales bacterium]|jgi:hypothetical protein|nr:cytochrome c [Arenicellales bacterium]MDP7489968.1 cytochrome c [Arenicellales bacterium]|tara:strand:- start:328 stop:645 length:318 start_codon:yes stop_codon:yes gene_type:complete
MKKLCTTITLAGLLSWSLPAVALLPGEADDGKPLHDSRCTSCHDSMFGGNGNIVYTREDRRVKTIEGLMGQVDFCNEQIGAGLNDHELEDIVAYLNEAFYQFEIE